MWNLTIEDDEGKQTQLPLAHEEYAIGRGETNTIRLTDRNVSRNHAILRKNGQGWLLKDLQSYNGTYINGVRVVGEAALSAGEIAQLGDYRFELADDVAAAQAVPGAAPPAVPPVHLRPNRLVVVVGPQPGTEYPLDKDHFTLGRSEDTDISINHSSVSRVHAELFPLGNGRFEIVDKASANGIRINGVDLKRGILEAGDALELGDVRLRFVGAGKIYRADVTQTLAAVQGLEGAAGAAKSGISTGKIAAICAGIALVVILGAAALVMRSGPPPAEGQTKHVVNVANAKQLEDALKLLDQKDYDGAHKKLLEIPEDVRPTEADDFKKVESAWADWKLREVDAAAESSRKKDILKEIASTETVDAKQRTKAAEMIREIEAKEPPPVPVEPWRPSGGGSYVPPPSTATTTKPAETTVVVQPLPPPTPPPELSGEAAIRKQLEPKVWGGRGSIDDIKMLRAICGHMGDHACRNRASELLKKKLAESP